MDNQARHNWLTENTQQFLALDLSNTENIVRFRKEREATTLPQRLREDTYVCPFVGYVEPNASMRMVRRKDGLHSSVEPNASMRMVRNIERHPVALRPRASMRFGCLLHPQGSPHPQISILPHPQNFSFYGEGICQSYDCLAKERRAHRADFFRWAEKAPLFAYSRLASDHTLHRALSQIDLEGCDLSTFYDTLAMLYEKYNVVTTSFEDIEKEVPRTWHDLCVYLATKISLHSTGSKEAPEDVTEYVNLLLRSNPLYAATDKAIVTACLLRR